MKQVLYTLLFLSIPFLAFSQHESEEFILKSPPDWISEVIPFPLGFAPQLNYTGVEELRFSKNWSKPDSADFWTYCFVWALDNDPGISAMSLHKDFIHYYNGLMGAVGRDLDSATTQITFPLFIVGTNPEEPEAFVGRMRVFDSFHSKQAITLNIKGREIPCRAEKKHLILFYLSPQEFDHEVWERFGEIELNIDCD